MMFFTGMHHPHQADKVPAAFVIVAASVAFLRNDPNYPVEWVEDAFGPHCTAFDPVVLGGVIRDARQLVFGVV